MLIECSMCGAPLCSVVEKATEIQLVYRVTAKCCHCGNKSYEKTFHGRIAFASTDYSQATPYPEFDAQGQLNGNILVETERLNKWQ
jgi:hypothetical protein